MLKVIGGAAGGVVAQRRAVAHVVSGTGKS
jgi:hypothetical protein